MKDFNWREATLRQLYHIIKDEDCPRRYKLEAKQEIERRNAARRANIRWRAMGRNWG